MLREKVQQIMGQVSDSEFKKACDITDNDIKGNHMWLKQHTNLTYILLTIIIAIGMIRRQEKSA